MMPLLCLRGEERKITSALRSFEGNWRGKVENPFFLKSVKKRIQALLQFWLWTGNLLFRCSVPSFDSQQIFHGIFEGSAGSNWSFWVPKGM